jgi:hypothetical protein
MSDNPSKTVQPETDKIPLKFALAIISGATRPNRPDKNDLKTYQRIYDKIKGAGAKGISQKELIKGAPASSGGIKSALRFYKEDLYSRKLGRNLLYFCRIYDPDQMGRSSPKPEHLRK